jgi:hypothetical protein
VKLPAAFMAQVPSGTELALHYSVGSSGVETKLGQLPLWLPHSLGINTENSIYTTIPAHDMFGGDQFNIEIRSLFPMYVKTAEVRVTVGAGLQIIGDYAATANGADVFFGTMDRVSSLASASLARKGSTSLVTDGRPTNELLFTLRVKVPNGASEGADGRIVVEGIRFKDGNEELLSIATAGVVVDRRGENSDGSASVHVIDDSVVNVLGYAEGPTELLNTAVISGMALKVPIRVKGIKVRGGEVDLTNSCTCRSSNENVLHVAAQGCTAMLDGSETDGARSVSVIADCGEFSTSIMFRVHRPVSVELDASSSQIRPVAGWFNEGVDASCNTLHYQGVSVFAKATFSDGYESGPTFVDFDVSNIVRLESSNAVVASVESTVSGNNGVRIHGHTDGSFMIYAIGKDQSILARINMEVTDASSTNVLAVIGLDVHFVDALGAVTLNGTDSSVPRNHLFGIEVAQPTTIKMQYEGDLMAVVSWAVLDDHSRVLLKPSNGLHTVSLNVMAASVSIVDEGQTVVVVAEPEAHSGALLEVSWKPSGECFAKGPGFGEYGHRAVSMEVTPPQAESMSVSISSTLLVCNGDAASERGADFPTSVQIEVSLHFSDKVQSGLENDARTSYVVSAGAPFAVDALGLVAANMAGIVGSGTITVHFQGQNVTSIVSIEVTRFAVLEVTASPQPAYAGSTGVSLAMLSAIECTTPLKYQQAKLDVSMVLANGLEKVLAPSHTEFRIEASVPRMLQEFDRVVSVSKAGVLHVFAQFGSVESKSSVEMNVNGDPAVAFVTLDNMTLFNSGKTVTTLTGGQGIETAHVALGATLSDGRQYSALFDGTSATPALSGVVHFESMLPSKVSVDSVTGMVTLLDNHYEPIIVEARACENSKNRPSASIPISANLRPVITGDVDLGYLSGAPVTAKSVGAKITVPVRVNTGNKELAAFNIRIQFDPTLVMPVLSEVKHTIASSKGAVDMKSSVSESGDEIVLAAVIQRSKVIGGSNGVAIAEVVFIAIAPGYTTLSGIAVQLLDTTVGNPLPIGVPNAAFRAGLIPLAIFSDRVRRGVRQFVSPMYQSVDVVLATQARSLRQLATADQQVQARTRRQGLSAALRRADANCDGKISLEDPIRINDFIAARNGGFQTELGQRVLEATIACRKTLGESAISTTFLDPDGSTVVEGIDATYLLDIMVQNFYFYDLTTVTAVLPSCVFSLQVMLTNDVGSAPRAGTRLLVDLGLDGVHNGLEVSFLSSDQVVTTDKGSSHLHGALIEAKQSEADPRLFVATVNIPYIAVNPAGISIVQIANEDMAVSPRWKLFTGPESDPQYAGALVYPADTLAVSAGLSRSGGYNPLYADIILAQPECQSSTTAATTTATTTTVTAAMATGTATTTIATATTTTTARASTVPPYIIPLLPTVAVPQIEDEGSGHGDELYDADNQSEQFINTTATTKPPAPLDVNTNPNDQNDGSGGVSSSEDDRAASTTAKNVTNIGSERPSAANLPASSPASASTRLPAYLDEYTIKYPGGSGINQSTNSTQAPMFVTVQDPGSAGFTSSDLPSTTDDAQRFKFALIAGCSGIGLILLVVAQIWCAHKRKWSASWDAEQLGDMYDGDASMYMMDQQPGEQAAHSPHGDGKITGAVSYQRKTSDTGWDNLINGSYQRKEERKTSWSQFPQLGMAGSAFRNITSPFADTPNYAPSPGARGPSPIGQWNAELMAAIDVMHQNVGGDVGRRDSSSPSDEFDWDETSFNPAIRYSANIARALDGPAKKLVNKLTGGARSSAGESC